MMKSHQYIDIPKIELHKHLEGSIRLKTLMELSGIQNVTKAQKLFQVRTPMGSLEAVLNGFDATQKLLNTEEILERITYEVIEDAFHQNIKILELRYAPSFIAEGHSLSYEQIHSAILKGKEKACRKYDIGVGFIGIIVRSHSLEIATQCMDFILDPENQFIGVDLADNEEDFSPELFRDCFLKAKNQHMPITIHAGEVNTSQAPNNIKTAIDSLGASRIGHGLQCIQDPAIMRYLKEKNIHLELCPISNWLTHAINEKADHPFVAIQNYGISCGINSDDPGLFGTSLPEDYQMLESFCGLEYHMAEKANQDAFKASFLPNKSQWANYFSS